MRKLLRSAMMTCVLVPGLSLLHAGVVGTFDFEADTGQFIPFTSNAICVPPVPCTLTATFSSTSDPGFLVAAGAGFQSLSGNFLVESATGALTILFSAPQTSISLNFATFDLQSLNLDAFIIIGGGGTPVGVTTSATGTAPGAGALPEGVLTFSGGTFNAVVLNSQSPFAIDNVTVNDAPAGAVPEPGSLLLCAGALAALPFIQRRRRT